ncbi:hypothetical protein E2C01_012379 [Portunus trituberculatus]|uniref:Uncharacterized protein n=1 Tax=Portunus trituberculatus TaxID=210409 RepID=A0A5B7DDX9_PORTR|nr:hypothetical protein [Portunus trituberculatus]
MKPGPREGGREGGRRRCLEASAVAFDYNTAQVSAAAKASFRRRVRAVREAGRESQSRPRQEEAGKGKGKSGRRRGSDEATPLLVPRHAGARARLVFLSPDTSIRQQEAPR